MSDKKGLDLIPPTIIAMANLVKLLFDLQNKISLMSFSMPFFVIWFSMIFALLYPLKTTLESLRKEITLFNFSRILIISLIAVFNSYIFIMMGFALSYFGGIVFSIFSILIFILGFIFERNNLVAIWRTGNGKLVTSIFIFTILFLPSILTLINPAINEPKIVVSPSIPEIFFPKRNDTIEFTLTVKNIRGYAWNFKASADVLITEQDPEAEPLARAQPGIYVYMDGILKGECEIDYLPYRHQEEIPIKLIPSFRIIRGGNYTLKMPYEYTNAKGNNINDVMYLPIYIESYTKVYYLRRQPILNILFILILGPLILLFLRWKKIIT